MGNNRKKVTRILAAAAAVLCLGAMPAAGNVPAIVSGLSISASAATKVTYVDSSGENKTRSTYTNVKSSTAEFIGGWYVVSGKVTIEDRLYVSDDTNLILTDGSRLTVKGGIEVGSGVKFNVYTQDGGTGALYAGTTTGSNVTAGYGNCGIGGRNAIVNIMGGNIYARGGSNAYGIYGSTIRLYWTNPTDSVFASSYSTTYS